MLLRLLTARRIGGSGYWKATGKLSVLLAAFFSPRTGTIVAVTVYEPADGDALSVTGQLYDWPADVVATTACPLMLELLSVTLQTTPVSVFWPVLAKLSVNVGGGEAGSVLVELVESVVPATSTELS